MIFVYVLIGDGYEWEDMIIFLTEKEAIDASKKYPKARVQMFSYQKDVGYVPTYYYYKNGEMCNIP
jgi:hypothetical protein